ncbi:MAG TPA: M12 family metallo-peptidase [Panacibacter sp.]|nr:M12 family metallo-peptidase [Panacibacter sp.]
MVTKTKLLLTFIVLFTTTAFSQNNFWKDVPRQSLESLMAERKIQPSQYRTLELNITGFDAFAKSLPLEGTTLQQQQNAIISIPMPDGSFSKFNIVQSPVMEPALAAKFPSIKTYSGKGIDDKTAVIKIDRTVFGFHAMILSPVTGSVFIDPVDNRSQTSYISYYKKDVKPTFFFEEGDVINENIINQPDGPTLETAGICIGTELRTYRLAVSCTGEYSQALGAATKEEALSFIVTSVNRVDGVYETELAVRMILVADEDKIVFVNPATDPFTANDNGGALLGENQKVVTDSIGSFNYDVGHIFSTGGGGVAQLGVICISNSKAKGVTGLPYPAGDPYDIDYVAHEMGHEFGANHPFNSKSGSCKFNGVKGVNVEPGSGSTIMAYAGICYSDDLQPHSDAQFHAINRDEILNYLINGAGQVCAVKTANGNQSPVANAGPDYVIPISTPFTVTGSGSDPDGDAITFDWEEMDAGGPFGAWDKPSGKAPLFRSFTPAESPSRTFPQLNDILYNSASVGEIMASYARDINLRLTVRDNRYGGGGVCADDMLLTADAASGPFVVTEPAFGTNWNLGESYTVTWDVANTNTAPVNCQNVNILLSTDGGSTFPYTLATNTANDGTQQITLPLGVNVTNAARVKVEAADNVFFDISDADFHINGTLPLQWLSFTVEKTGSHSALLKWNTGSETGNSHFEVEHSSTGASFNKIGTVTASGSLAAVHQYSYTDNLLSGTTYYRIKQVDKDGRSSYSVIVKVTAETSGINWVIQPNPARTKTTVLFTDLSKVKSILISDAQGKVMYKNTPGVAGGNSIEIPLSNFAKGMYFITVITETGTRTEKLIVN